MVDHGPTAEHVTYSSAQKAQTVTCLWICPTKSLNTCTGYDAGEYQEDHVVGSKEIPGLMLWRNKNTSEDVWRDIPIF